MRILVVEDDPAVRNSLSRALRLEGYEAELHEEGATAIRSLQVAAPDAILLDLQLPDVDGVEICRRVRATGDRTPILMVTARDAVDDRSPASTRAPTTTWSSRSTSRSSSPGSARCSAAEPRPRERPRSSASRT